MTINWKAVEQYFTVLLFVSQFYPVLNFEKSNNFGLGTVRSERVKATTQRCNPVGRGDLQHKRHFIGVIQ